MKLKDIIEEYISGDWGNEDFSPETPCAVYCVRGADIVPISNDQFNDIPLRYVSKRTKDNKTLRAGDLVIEKSGGSPVQSTGRITYISQELIDSKQSVVCSNFCTSIRIKDSWNSKFIYYYWQYIYNSGVFFNFEGKTSGLKNLQFDNAIASIDIPEYTLEQQTEIADILSKLESKMTVNREINRNLEAMARQLYNYWFIQFDFPDENEKPYKSSGGKMVWNEKLKREIPEGWSHTTIERYANIQNGATPSTSDEANYGGDIVWITPKDLSDQSQKFTFRGERSITDKGYNSCSTTLLPKGTVLMSSRAPIGLLSIAAIDLCTNQGFKSLVPKHESEQRFLYYIVDQFLPFIKQMGSGTTFSEVSKDELAKLKVPDVPSNVIEQWNAEVEPIFRRQKLILKEIYTLTTQRDELLPLLMNGQVSVMPSEVNCDLSHD